jgi:glycine hydroxymethyltransferase
MNRSLKKNDPEIFLAIRGELKRQQNGLELIASENYVSESVLEALGSVLTNKYSEGYPGKRYYGGQEFTDVVESLAIGRAKKLFGAQHVNVQPLSGAPANLAVYSAVLKPGDTVLGMNLSHGGHLTHGHPVTFPAQIYRFVRYGTEPDGTIDYEKLARLARKEKPKLLLAGFSSYTRKIDYAKFRAIADETKSILMFDMAHVAGLIAGKAYPNPVPYFDIMTTTTHKTLRGPRGGMILCRKEFAQAIDKAVFPGLQGGPHEHNIAAKAVAFGEALDPSFRAYAKQVVKNAKTLEREMSKRGFFLEFGGTDSHMILMNVMKSRNITGRQAEVALDLAGMTTNKNVVPDDPRGPMDPSGIRIGVAAITTRGMMEPDVSTIAGFIDEALSNHDNARILGKIRRKVKELCMRYPLYEGLYN